jgi:hypothetical protein
MDMIDRLIKLIILINVERHKYIKLKVNMVFLMYMSVFLSRKINTKLSITVTFKNGIVVALVSKGGDDIVFCLNFYKMIYFMSNEKFKLQRDF